MTRLVLPHKAGSIHEAGPDRVRDLPKAYLRALGEGVGDWAITHGPVKAGPRGYFAVARIADVSPKPGVAGWFLALVETGSFLPFDPEVPMLREGRPLERSLRAADGTPALGGAVQRAVRRLAEEECAAIVRLGLPDDLIEAEARRYDPAPVWTIQSHPSSGR